MLGLSVIMAMMAGPCLATPPGKQPRAPLILEGSQSDHEKTCRIRKKC